MKLRLAGGRHPHQRRMPSRHVVKPAGRQVQHAVDDREIKPRKLVGLEELVELRGHLGRRGNYDLAVRSLPHEDRLVGDLVGEKPPHRHRHQRRGHPVAAHVDHKEPGMLGVEGKDVEKVTGEALTRHIPPGDLGAGEIDRIGGQQRLLHLRRRLEVADHPGVFPRDLVVEHRQLGIRLLEMLAGDGEIFVGSDQFLIFRDGVFKRRNEQIEHLLPAGLYTKFLPRDRHLKRRLLGDVAHRRLEQGVHPPEQVFRLVWLGDVVVGPGVEAADDVNWIRERGEEDEGHVPQGGVGFHRLAEFVAGHHRHLDVGDDDVGHPLLGELERLGAVLTPADRMAGLGEPLLEDLRLDAAVFRDQHVTAAGRTVSRSAACVTRHDRTSPPRPLCGGRYLNVASAVGASLWMLKSLSRLVNLKTWKISGRMLHIFSRPLPPEILRWSWPRRPSMALDMNCTLPKSRSTSGPGTLPMSVLSSVLISSSTVSSRIFASLKATMCTSPVLAV